MVGSFFSSWYLIPFTLAERISLFVFRSCSSSDHNRLLVRRFAMLEARLDGLDFILRDATRAMHHMGASLRNRLVTGRPDLKRTLFIFGFDLRTGSFLGGMFSEVAFTVSRRCTK